MAAIGVRGSWVATSGPALVFKSDGVATHVVRAGCGSKRNTRTSGQDEMAHFGVNAGIFGSGKRQQVLGTEDQGRST